MEENLLRASWREVQWNIVRQLAPINSSLHFLVPDSPPDPVKQLVWSSYPHQQKCFPPPSPISQNSQSATLFSTVGLKGRQLKAATEAVLAQVFPQTRAEKKFFSHQRVSGTSSQAECKRKASFPPFTRINQSPFNYVSQNFAPSTSGSRLIKFPLRV